MQGILFDLDGVLINSATLHYQSWQEMGTDFPQFEMQYEDFLETFGEPNEAVLKKHLPHLDPDIRQQLGEKKEEFYRKLCGSSLPWLPGIQRFLQRVESENIPKIIASSTARSNLDFFLKETELGKYFNHFVCAQDVTIGKPAPDIFIKAAKKINVPVENCIVIEDSPAGLLAGHRAGCFVVALGTTHQLDQLENYHLSFDHPESLDFEKIKSSMLKWK